MSVWPLGPLHYVWPRGRGQFWSDDARVSARDAYAVDDALADALRLRREVLFATTRGSAFVAVPAGRDDELRRRLRLS